MNSQLKPEMASSRLEQDREELTALVERYAQADGVWPTAWPALSFFRADSPGDRTCAMYEPCLGLLLQGNKHILLGEERFEQENGHYLISSIDVPVSAQVIRASRQQPCLCLTLRLDPVRIGEWLSELKPARPATARGLALSPVNGEILDPLLRLVRLLDTPEDLPLLAPLIERELIYRLLTGEQGARLAQIALNGGQGQQIARAIQWLKLHYNKPLRISDLANLVNMSASSLHHHFREITAMSPLQYQKVLRLHEARRLLLTEGCDVATAAHRVGYESPSQFSREYSRQHGAPPLRDVNRLRAVGASVMALES
ncbi:AraC family transcriptional regulator [Dyella acidiphila]|uniref:AraC family transcriptional regulator n=1 Tax=Dyella acidiphila TaxID=2775866 RepID=A0ABR9GAT4_9GAMM|nr:AraC family transcriptional regulator [Dyella acidiphila]MBE1161146.1 AraC family transcriptional regulator [Dyella acidiphila]